MAGRISAAVSGDVNVVVMAVARPGRAAGRVIRSPPDAVLQSESARVLQRERDNLIAELDTTKQRRLLLLDNFESTWLSRQDQAQVNDILVRLAALPHIAMLVTMTSGSTPGDVEWQHRLRL